MCYSIFEYGHGKEENSIKGDRVKIQFFYSTPDTVAFSRGILSNAY